ncbi:hypothetical protein Cabys_1309 [Caldithrix abyssi DSM 13497]|uniref:Uncharacterized protein n=1 Tax=Caldithrix abyssi DSM 13497 TaxID=880073 RepID=A0A1J1C7S8_CALAY|nr:hypothetical protein Cabys_1309 [Caldithrix abyssi DSM 13497]
MNFPFVMFFSFYCILCAFIHQRFIFNKICIFTEIAYILLADSPDLKNQGFRFC